MCCKHGVIVITCFWLKIGNCCKLLFVLTELDYVTNVLIVTDHKFQ